MYLHNRKDKNKVKEANSEPSQTSMMEIFAKIVNGLSSIIEVIEDTKVTNHLR